ncbi:MAG: alkyl hydroperoxide reductase subunit F [Rhodocyclaceae bacterium]|nr:MAG: alkyl hydroperoxide reductase subunit F [Rhodocyclaceae bacterium]
MLDSNIKAQLAAYLEKLQRPIELVASLDDSAKAQEMRGLLTDIAELSPKVSLREDGTAALRPSFAIGLPGETPRITFAGIPMGHEFTSLVLALLQTGGHPPKVEQAVIDQIKALPGTFNFETYISLSCHNCPDVVQALNLMAVLNPGVTSTMIDGAMFQDVVNARQIMAVPTTYLNGEEFGAGRMLIEEILAKVDTGAAARAAEALGQKEAFDVLVVGGGPAGAAAAVYAARKGIRTGILAERFGGQVMDTLGIENFISVSHTEGPKLVAALEQHVKDYEVDIMTLQRAAKLVPASEAGGLVEIQLENGASLKSKSVILATGARWREMNVPGPRASASARTATARCSRASALPSSAAATPASKPPSIWPASLPTSRCSNSPTPSAPTPFCRKSSTACPTSPSSSQRKRPKSPVTARRSTASPTRTALRKRSSTSNSKASSSRSACCPTPTGSRARST